MTPETDANAQPERPFDRISHNNSAVDEAVDQLVEQALDRVGLARQQTHGRRGDEQEVRKMSRLLLLFGLFGQRH